MAFSVAKGQARVEGNTTTTESGRGEERASQNVAKLVKKRWVRAPRLADHNTSKQERKITLNAVSKQEGPYVT